MIYKRRGFFFTVDALIALGVLVVGFLLILSTYSYRPTESQIVFFSEDILDLFSGATVAEFNDRRVFQMWCQSCPGARHIITNRGNTLLEQLGEFYYLGQLEYANETAGYIIEGLVNPQYSYEFSIKGADRVVLYRKDKEHQQEERSNLLISSKRLVYGIYNNEIVWGPYVAEVRIWQ